jgi:tRNA(Ile2) C34 agmatinyltransferase TiaS
MRATILRGKFNYRCRRCGVQYRRPPKIKQGRDLTEPAQMRQHIEEATTGRMLDIHDCGDGYGIADLTGGD